MTTTIEFITALFCQVADQIPDIPKHPQASLWPSEVVTLGLLHALKGVGNRPFYRWLTRDYRPWKRHEKVAIKHSFEGARERILAWKGLRVCASASPLGGPCHCSSPRVLHS